MMGFRAGEGKRPPPHTHTLFGLSAADQGPEEFTTPEEELMAFWK
jgi:hypothetical protein